MSSSPCYTRPVSQGGLDHIKALVYETSCVVVRPKITQNGDIITDCQ